MDENHGPKFAAIRKAKESILLERDEARCVSEVLKVVCASVQGQERKIRPPLKSIQVGGLFECIGMDFKQMDVSHSGNRYIP